MTNYPNWFAAGAQWFFQKNLPLLADRKIVALQIGAYTGDATVWMLENFLTHPESVLTDVDTWQGSEEAIHKNFDWKNVEDVYREKTSKYLEQGKLIKYKGTSDAFFAASSVLRKKYDFIYVDGDHTAKAVLKDGVNALEACAPGGIVAFDDYTWQSGKGPTHDPRVSIDALIVAYADDFEVIDKGSQVWLRNVK